MEQRPVIVKNSGSVPTAAIVGIVVLVAVVALFLWQPWNATTKTTIINQQPGTSADQNANGNGTTGNGTTSGSGTTSGNSGTGGSSSSGSGSNP